MADWTAEVSSVTPSIFSDCPPLLSFDPGVSTPRLGAVEVFTFGEFLATSKTSAVSQVMLPAPSLEVSSAMSSSSV